jgi:hypothetical protein
MSQSIFLFSQMVEISTEELKQQFDQEIKVMAT